MKKVNGSKSFVGSIVHPDTNPSFSSILAGIAYGDVWVNQMEFPTLALVYSAPVDGFHVLGGFKDEAEKQSFKQFLEQELFPELKSKGTNDFEFSAESPETEKQLLACFQEYDIITDYDMTFIKKPGGQKYHSTGPQNICSTFVDKACINQKFHNPEVLYNSIREA